MGRVAIGSMVATVLAGRTGPTTKAFVSMAKKLVRLLDVGSPLKKLISKCCCCKKTTKQIYSQKKYINLSN